MGYREHEVERLRRQLERKYWPRWRMLVITLITAGVGFIASYGLLHLGVTTMMVRYLLALGVAYASFLLLVRWWASVFDIDDAADGVELSVDLANMDGGGISVDGDLGLDALSGAADGEAVPLIVVIALVVATVAVLLSCVWIIYDAPALFAELCVDSMLAAGLYKRLRHTERRHWLESLTRRTARPLLGIAFGLSLLAGIAHHYAPSAATLGQALHEMRGK